MKSFIFIFLLTTSIPLLFHAQEIPNYGFEEWDTNNGGMLQPIGWETPNEPELTFVEAQTGRTGNHSACLNVKWDSMLRKFCGATLITEFDLQDTLKEKSFEGYYKGSAENTDTLEIEILVYNELQLVGSGCFKVLDKSNNWIKFFIPISLEENQNPTRVKISFLIKHSNGNPSLSRYLIDDLKFTFSDYENVKIISKILTS